MSNSETQRKLKKLEKLEQGNRARVRRYMEKVKGEGKKQLSAIVSGEVYEEITRRKNASNPPLTNGQVIEQAIFGSINTDVKSDVSINVKRPEPDQGTEEPNRTEIIKAPTPAVERPGVMSDQPTGKSISDILDGIDPDNLTIEDRDRIVLKLQEVYPGKKQAQARVDILNNAGILFNGEPWTTKQFSDQRSMAKKRAKK